MEIRTPYEDIKQCQEAILAAKEKIKRARVGLADSLGRNIQRRRGSLGMTQQQLSDLSGVGRAMIANIEGGKNRGSLDSFLAICIALQTTADKLLEAEAPGPKMPPVHKDHKPKA